ncbi:MAG: fibronectin type III domain-containing protein, partial [Chloroflexi bacterium]|nr:fibronectin type III domain-containing protein [Chloroflexota bacterium]
MRHWIEQHAPRLHIPLLARGRASRPLVPVSALLALTLLLAARPGVGADATCDVPPINLTSALGEDNASVVLTWESSGECTPDEYAIYRRDMDVESSRMTKIDSVNGDVLTYTDTTVTAGEDYRYRIRSNDLGRRSARTDITIPEAAVNEPEPEPVPEPTQRSTRQNFDVTPPSLQVVNVDGTSLVLIYDELLDES